MTSGLDEYHNKTSNIPTRLVPILNDGMIAKENKIRLLMLYYLTEEKATEGTLFLFVFPIPLAIFSSRVSLLKRLYNRLGRSRFEQNARLTAAEEQILTNFIGIKDLTSRTVLPLVLI
jgi:hypothetical protein